MEEQNLSQEQRDALTHDPAPAEPSEQVSQDPPEGFEPQPDLQPGQDPEVQERESDLVSDAEAEVDSASEADGVADDDSAIDDVEDEQEFPES